MKVAKLHSISQNSTEILVVRSTDHTSQLNDSTYSLLGGPMLISLPRDRQT